MHHLTLQVPEAVYQTLSAQAHRQGRSVEDWLSAALARAAGSYDEDRLMRWSGALTSGVADAAEQHDRYLGQALLRELNGTPNA